ncbi:hypothetical protein [Bifidobacterium indicum]|uniref:hypothetical protein n=1 Tax=Bifidobacterium indicum TaxID=1691 RepID=UPI0030DA1AC5
MSKTDIKAKIVDYFINCDVTTGVDDIDAWADENFRMDELVDSVDDYMETHHVEYDDIDSDDWIDLLQAAGKGD